MILKNGDEIEYNGVKGLVISTTSKGAYLIDKEAEADRVIFLTYDMIDDMIEEANINDNTNDSKTACNPSEIASDDIKHPDRYNCGGYECQRVIEAVTADLQGIEAVNTGHIIRYAWRWKKKQPIKSLKKIKEYCDDLIAYLEKRGYSENDE